MEERAIRAADLSRDWDIYNDCCVDHNQSYEGHWLEMDQQNRLWGNLLGDVALSKSIQGYLCPVRGKKAHTDGPMGVHEGS